MSDTSVERPENVVPLPSSVAELEARAESYFRSARAPNTVRAYRHDLEDFATWCKVDASDLSPMPAVPRTVALYITDAAGRGLKAATIQRRLAAIAQLHQEAGLDDPTKTKAVRNTWRGIAREIGTYQEGKAPILVPTARRMLAAFEGERGPSADRDRVLILLGLAGGYRVSELTSLFLEDVEYVEVASHESARGLGTLVVLNDEIHAAHFVQKTHTSNPATFRSPLAGPVGYVFEDSVRISTHPVGSYHVDLPEQTRDHPVALYTVGLGDDGRLLEQVGHLGYEGLVIEAFGVGHVPSAMVEPLESLANEMPVILASRTASGEVHKGTYGFTGSESDLLERGLINAGILGGPKARLFLSLLLRSEISKEEIAGQFDHWSAG